MIAARSVLEFGPWWTFRPVCKVKDSAGRWTIGTIAACCRTIHFDRAKRGFENEGIGPGRDKLAFNADRTIW